MKVSAIICEYNPLHNGHVHHIQETRRKGATHIICLLSSNFVQRGDVALLNKFDRAQLAVRAGADLVLELPTSFSCAAAETYASGAVSLLRQLGIVDELSFGCSTGDLESMILLTDASLSTTQIYGSRIQERMKQGDSYPAAVWEIVRQRYGAQVAEKMSDPINLLAIEYMKAMRRQNVSFSALTVQRLCVMHDSTQTSRHFASASFIRQSLLKNDFSCTDFMPSFTADMLSRRISEGRTATVKQLERVALYRMRTISEQELLKLPDMNEPLAKRFLAARNANTLDDMLMQVKTKCYTLSRIRRIVMCALLGIRKEILLLDPPYARVLAFNERGRELMGIAQKKSHIPIHTSLAKLRDTGRTAEVFVEQEERASHVYGLAQRTISSAEEDFRARIILESHEKVPAGGLGGAVHKRGLFGEHIEFTDTMEEDE
ncbi:MAG: nucleotidyltransferase family protein [Oscillospiraceae bacterium]|nr:nucleotidyltransferase family protein [Oscillospiraceae bacterium]